MANTLVGIQSKYTANFKNPKPNHEALKTKIMVIRGPFPTPVEVDDDESCDKPHRSEYFQICWNPWLVKSKTTD